MLDRKPHHKTFKQRETPIARTGKGLSRPPFQTKPRSTGRGKYSALKAKPYRPLSTRKGIKDELDKVTSLLVRARDKQCVTCHTTENLTCSHYFKRSFLATRWNLINCNAQCAKHNELHNRVPWPYREYMVKLIGEDGLDELFALRNSVWRPTDDDLRVLLNERRRQLRETRRVA